MINSTLAMKILANLNRNLTYLADPVKNGVVFKYDPEAPVLDKRGKPTGKKYGKLTTTIIFDDGTTCSVANSVHDKVNAVLVSEYNGVKLPVPVLTADDTAKEFGIISALFARCIGMIKPDGTIDKSGSGKWLKDQITKNSYDQGVMEVYGKAVKKLEAEENAKKHEAAAKKAHDRKVKKLAKRLAIQREAEALLAAKKASGCSCTGTKKPLCETKIAVKPAIKTITEPKTCCCKTKTASSFSADDKPYVRPNKRFSEFTQAEKREYWKAQKRGWL